MTSDERDAHLEFRITFHSGFRVGAAYGRDGVDLAVDHDDPLPASHLKGLMRAAATRLLRLPEATVSAVFGCPGLPAPWAWERPVLDDAPSSGGGRVVERTRVTIDPSTHSALKDHLVVAEQVWAPGARFAVSRVAWGDAACIAEESAVLVASACAIHHLGGWRRRGWGWVTVAPLTGQVEDAVLDVVQRLREVGA